MNIEQGGYKVSILKNLYDGKLHPTEVIIPKNANYYSLAQEIGNEYKYFATKLFAEDKERFEKWGRLLYEYEEMVEYANFLYGFKLGTKMMVEVFAEGEVGRK